MPATNCPFCKALVNFGVSQEFNNLPPYLRMAQQPGRYMTVLQCSNETCKMLLLAVTESNRITRMWPDLVGGKPFPDVPEQIASAADEAYQCFSIKAFRASTLLARSVIEATAKEKGVQDGGLMKKIDDMHSQGLVREFVRDGAHEVRYLGNDVAHGDFVDPVDEEDARLALSLMEEVLNEIFQAPARVAAARARRVAKTQT